MANPVNEPPLFLPVSRRPGTPRFALTSSTRKYLALCFRGVVTGGKQWNYKSSVVISCGRSLKALGDAYCRDVNAGDYSAVLISHRAAERGRSALRMNRDE